MVMEWNIVAGSSICDICNRNISFLTNLFITNCVDIYNQKQGKIVHLRVVITEWQRKHLIGSDFNPTIGQIVF